MLEDLITAWTRDADSRDLIYNRPLYVFLLIACAGLTAFPETRWWGVAGAVLLLAIRGWGTLRRRRALRLLRERDRRAGRDDLEF